MPRREIASRVEFDGDQSLPEERIFDKTDEAEMREKELAALREERDDLKKELDGAEEKKKASIQSRIKKLEDKMDGIKASLNNDEETN